MTIRLRQIDAEERPVRELGYGTHDLPAGTHRIRTPDGNVRDLEADDSFCVTVQSDEAAAPQDGLTLSHPFGRFAELAYAAALAHEEAAVAGMQQALAAAVNPLEAEEPAQRGSYAAALAHRGG